MTDVTIQHEPAPPPPGVTFARLRAAALGALLLAFAFLYGQRDIPRQVALAGELRERLGGLADAERRVEMFHALPARRRLYRDYFHLIEGVRAATAEHARIGFVWDAPRYLVRFAPYYLHPRHTFEVERDAARTAAAALRLDALVTVAHDGRELRYTIEHVD